MKTLLLAILLMASCINTLPVEKSRKSENRMRYSVSLRDPPIVTEGAIAIAGNPDQWPELIYLSKNGEIYEGDHLRAFSEDSLGKRNRWLGLGPTFLFNKVDEKEAENQSWFTKGSMILSYQNGLVARDYNDLFKESPSDAIEIDDLRDLMTCRLSAKSRLSCYVPDSNNDNAKTHEKILWQDEKNPIVELTTNSYPGVYFFSEDGSLWHFERELSRVGDIAQVNPGMRFLKNRRGRHFIQATHNDLCVQRDNLAIYCSEHNELGALVAPGDNGGPELKKILDFDFKVDEVAYSGHHACFLTENSDVFCKGTNFCGQITGRHDQERYFATPKKIDVLVGKAVQLFTYAGGTCALLDDGRVQCLGLGASVMRKKVLPINEYAYSFSWVRGFRPNNICVGGAEYGL